MKKLFYTFFLISLTTFCQKTKPIYGTLLDSLGAVENVNIFNETSKIGTNSNTNGEFKIFSKLGDTLVFSSIQHQTKKIIVNERSFISFNFKIYLALKTYQLDEFELKKHNLLGLLALDISQIKIEENNINAISLGLPNAGTPRLKQIDRKIYTATTSNLDLILNSISGRLRKLKHQKKIIEDNEEVYNLFAEYNFNLTADFKIDKEDEYRFLYYCISDPNFTVQKSKNKFEFILFLKEKAIEFNKLKKE